ncbi:MAG: lysophospholipase [Spirochaetaceae bacterium]|nr:lysophospholipase [Spirochaetaceae bacterium]
MDERTSYITVRDTAQLFLRRWVPASAPPRGVVLAVHGLAEHSGRYRPLAETLAAAGIETWCFDLRGHGQTASLALNSPAIGGLLGHCADRKAFSKLLGDIDSVFAEIEKARPGLPRFLLGHSFGSFLAQGYIAYSKRPLAGCALSGTRGPGGAPLVAAAHFFNLYRFFRGRRHRSRFAASLVLGANNKPFRPNRSAADWLSRDSAEVDAYLRDPLCGGLCSAGFFRDMVWILQKIHTSSAMAKIKKDLPLYIFSGSDDPVGGMGKSTGCLLARYKQEGLSDIEYVLYPNARHEPLHEINRGEVMANLVEWLDRHIAGGGPIHDAPAHGSVIHGGKGSRAGRKTKLTMEM